MRNVRLALVLLAATAIGGCMVVRSSAPVAQTPQACVAGLGGYALPKAHLRVLVQQTGNAPPVLESIALERHPDPAQTYCLDYLASITSNDKLLVSRDRYQNQPRKSSPADLAIKQPIATPFLQLVASKATDRAGEVIQRAIQLVEIRLSSNAEFSGRATPAEAAAQAAPPRTLASIEFDPLNSQALAEANQTLTKFGFCLTLGGYSYDISRASTQDYCSSPSATVVRHPSQFEARARQAKRQPTSAKTAIYYRPRAGYLVQIHTKADPGGTEPWLLRADTQVQLENLSPVLAIGVHRALFSERRTALLFDDGALTSVCVGKGSELEAAAQIPLDIAHGVLSLPARIIEASINTLTAQKNLIAAQESLLKLQRQFIEFERSKTETALNDLAPTKPPQEALKTSSSAPFVPSVPDALGTAAATTTEALDASGQPLRDICDALGIKSDAPVINSNTGATE